MDGYELAQRIIQVQQMWFERMKKDEGFRKNKAKQECPVVAVTAFNSQDIVERAKKVGIKQVLFKPVHVVQLSVIMKNYYYGLCSSI